MSGKAEENGEKTRTTQLYTQCFPHQRLMGSGQNFNGKSLHIKIYDFFKKLYKLKILIYKPFSLCCKEKLYACFSLLFLQYYLLRLTEINGFPLCSIFVLYESSQYLSFLSHHLKVSCGQFESTRQNKCEYFVL